MPAFQVQTGKGPYQRGGATAWGGGDRKTTPAASPDGSNPLPATSQSPAAQVYSQPAAQASPQAQSFGGTSGADAYRAPAQSGHWDMGQQGAEGAWSNGYNPHWEPAQQPAPAQQQMPVQSQAPQHRQNQTMPQATHRTAPQAAASPAAPSPSAPTSAAQSGFGDARDNPNNTMSVFYDPNAGSAIGGRQGYYYDYDNPALRTSSTGTKSSLADAGIAPGSAGDPTWDPHAIYKDPSSPFYIPPGDPRWGGA